jgi:dTDP-4-dehydrorhamnose 3,5-epimerase
MEFKRLAIPDIWLIKPTVFRDDRGFFYETFSVRIFQEAAGLTPTFVQDNHSKSVRGVLRGLHYQLPPHAQGKLVRVTQGAVFDVVVDIRQSSPTFGQWVGELLSADNRAQIWIPPGFAHGFLTLSESAEFLYKTTEFYEPSAEGAIVWNDPDLDIHWPLDEIKAAGLDEPILSGKDQQASDFKNAKVFE